MRDQQRFLNDALVARADLRYSLTSALKTLSGIIMGQLREDSFEISLASLRGLEGAAAAYFGGYIYLFADSLNFIGRKKRLPPDLFSHR